jgi:hypothetical protein
MSPFFGASGAVPAGGILSEAAVDVDLSIVNVPNIESPALLTGV